MLCSSVEGLSHRPTVFESQYLPLRCGPLTWGWGVGAKWRGEGGTVRQWQVESAWPYQESRYRKVALVALTPAHSTQMSHRACLAASTDSPGRTQAYPSIPVHRRRAADAV